MAAPDDTLAPIPPRYWWLKRILLALAVLIVALAGLHWWWGVQADHRWRACIARLEATGEPLYARDFAVPAIPDAENAAHFLKAAVAAMKPATSGRTFSELAGAPDSAAREREVAQALVDNVESLRLLRQARDAPGTDWGVDYSAGILAADSGDMYAQLQLAHLTELAGIAAHRRGDIRETLEYVRDLLRQARVLRAHRSLIGHLMGMGTDEIAAKLIERIAPDVTTAPSPSGTLGRGEIHDLIDGFFDESDVRTSWRWAWLQQRAWQLEVVQKVVEKRTTLAAVGLRPLAALFTPALNIDAVRVMEWASATIAMAEATNAVAAHDRYPAASDPSQKLNRYARLLSAFLLPDDSSLPEEHFKRVALRRLAAARLGLQLYVLDHGVQPDTLGRLVPEYLPAVPLDPLFDDGRPIEYTPGGSDAGLFAGRPRDPVTVRLHPPADE